MTEDNSQIQEVGGSGSGIATSTSMADVMRMFMEERQQREAQQAEERRKWEMEMERRDEYNRQHMEVLQSLVNVVHLQGEAANRRADRRRMLEWRN